MTNTKKYWFILFVILAAALGLEFVMHPHAYFGIDGTMFFHAWFGFASCVAIILVSKFLGLFLKRPEDYYGGDES